MLYPDSRFCYCKGSGDSIAYAKLGPTVPFMPAGQRRTERSEVSRCKVGTLKLVFLSIENKRSTIQFVIAEVAKRVQLNLGPTVASVIAKPVEIAYSKHIQNWGQRSKGEQSKAR